MFEKLPQPKTKNLHESTWDHHGSYQWTYFSDGVKHRIRFFLAQRLHGKNLDLCGGWHLLYPNSTVVDLSSVCLQHNPAKEKIQFDLDELGKGKKLPFRDYSFDSATLVSGWQYLKHPKKVAEELRRLIVPGGEVYLINGQGAGLEECVVGHSHSEKVAEFFRKQGYDTLIEPIPFARKDEFQSVCVAMPETPDLFGCVQSRIKNREARIEANGAPAEEFEEAYLDWEMEIVKSLFSKLSKYPITRYSKDFLDRTEAFSLECRNKTGAIPIVILEHSDPMSLGMLTEDGPFICPNMFLMGESSPPAKSAEQEARDLLKKFNLRFSGYIQYFGHRIDDIKSLMENCKLASWEGGHHSEAAGEIKKYAEFVSAFPLNRFTKDIQDRVYQAVRPGAKQLDQDIFEARMFGVYMTTPEYKNERKLAKLVERKNRIIGERIEVVGEGSFDYRPYLKEIRRLTRK